MKKYLILFLAIFALFFSSCSKDDSESSNYVGTWALVEGDVSDPFLFVYYYYTLESDGTLSEYEYYGSIYEDGIVCFEEGKEAARTMTRKVVFKGNKMYTKDEVYLATVDIIDEQTTRISDTSSSLRKGIYKRVKGFGTFKVH